MPDQPTHAADAGSGEGSGARSSDAVETDDASTSEADVSGEVVEIPLGTPVSPEEFEAMKRAARIAHEEADEEADEESAGC